MAARFRLSDQLKALEARSNELKHELNSLRTSKRHLLLRQALTSCWADTMSFVQLCLASRDCSSAPHGGQQQQQQQSDARIQQPVEDCDLLANLLGREVELLQQLSSTEGGVEEQPTLEALLQPGEVETISPCTDPMAYLQRTISQPPLPEAQHMTATDMAAYMQRAVLSLSIKLHKVGPVWSHCRRTGSRVFVAGCSAGRLCLSLGRSTTRPCSSCGRRSLCKPVGDALACYTLSLHSTALYCKQHVAHCHATSSCRS